MNTTVNRCGCATCAALNDKEDGVVDFEVMFNSMTTASLLALSDAASKEAARRIHFSGATVLPNNAGDVPFNATDRKAFLSATPLGERLLREEAGRR